MIEFPRKLLLCVPFVLMVSSPGLCRETAFPNGANSYAGEITVSESSEAEKSEEQKNDEPGNLIYKSKEWYQERDKLEVMIWASAIILTILFFGLVLVTFIRMGRHYRKRVTGDKKPEPTEYVDAWSQYRLEDDNDE